MIKLKDLIKISVKTPYRNKKQYVITYNDGVKDYIAFQSYNSFICLYDCMNKNMLVNWNKWDYSKTTITNFKHFVNEYTCFKYESKVQFIDVLRKDSSIVLFEE